MDRPAPAWYPVCLDLHRRHCLVVGGGAVGERKVLALLEAGARVTVVSPTLTPALRALAAARRIAHRRRAFAAADAGGTRVVIAATGRPGVDRDVARAARRAGALVNVVDRPAQCDFILPSVLRRGDLQIAVSTGGQSPALAREIRKQLEPLFGREYGRLVARVGIERRRALARATTPAARRAAGELAAASALGSGAPAAAPDAASSKRSDVAGLVSAAPRKPERHTGAPPSTVAGRR